MKKIFSIIFLLFTLTLYAEPIKEQRARELAVSFFNGGPMTRSVSAEVDLVWSGNALAETPALKTMSDTPELPSLYIFNRTDSDGFVIIAGDDRVRPVLAYSKEDSFDMNNIADGARFLISAWCEVIESMRSSNGNRFTADATIEDLSDIQDELIYETALWDQGEPFNREAPVMEDAKSVTGCVATAMSIIAYYNQYPAKGTGTTPEYQCSYNGIAYTIPANELGRTYDYSKMLFDYSNDYTEEQANAVAALMKDMGTAFMMGYSPVGSGAYDIDALYGIINYFGYSKDARMEMAESYSYDEWVDIIKENLNEFGPTYYSGGSTSGGHAFVVDGYDNKDYFHFNFGWSGFSNGYYYLPENVGYSYAQRAIVNMYPDENGTSQYTYNLAAYYSNYYWPGVRSEAAKYQTGVPFNLYLGAIVNLGAVDFTKGTFAFRLYDKSGNLKEVLKDDIEYEGQLIPEHNLYGDGPYSVTINSDIEPGDRIKVYYKGEGSTEWQLLRPYSSDAKSEIIVMASDVAEIQSKLNLEYSKSDRTLTLYSDDLALTISLEDMNNQALMEPVDLPAIYYTPVNMSSLPGGTYNFIIASGSIEYTLQITLPDPPEIPAVSSIINPMIIKGPNGDQSDVPSIIR